MTAPAASPQSEAPVPFTELLGGSEHERSTDDVLGAALPLLRQVLEVHDRGLVAPLVGAADVLSLGGRLWFENARCGPPRKATQKLAALTDGPSGALRVRSRLRTEETDDGLKREDLAVGERGAPLTRPVYLPGYVCWEHELEHQDPLTDIYVLGLILASLALDENLGDADHLRTFVDARRDVRRRNPRIHPMVARAIEQMTDLDRSKRPPDLRSLLAALERHREHELRPELDLEEIRGLVAKTQQSRRGVICERLRSQLFDLTRRNRLLYFKPTAQSLDLTELSVPLVLDIRNVSADALLTCRPPLVEALAHHEPLSLGKWLRFEDYPFAAPALDKLRTSAARAKTEYGFSSLKLAICFLHWHDLKNAPEERVHSPLLLVPVELTRKKGVRDAYLLTATSELAEVNPVLRHVLAQTYGIRLPDAVNLAEPGSLERLFAVLTEQIQASEPAVVLERIDQPAIDLVHARVLRRLDAFRKRRQLSGRGVRSRDGLEYSYRRDNFQPLGLRLFALCVSPSEAPAAAMFEKPRPRVTQMAASQSERVLEKELFSLRKAGDEGGPYRWGFDLTTVTLGNFDYQKMSLVRDYDALLAEERPNKPFDQLFSADARPALQPLSPAPLAEQFTVVAADGTQQAAVARARAGASFIIQGPPGTGKSQTITNLIADQVARGKRVLFVCEKRAALDVVFYRLRQLGLDRLTTVIHDSQGDKKSFVGALKQSYDAWMGSADQPPPPADREVRLAEVATPLGELTRLDQWMTAPAEGSTEPLVKVVRRSIELGNAKVELAPAQTERLPLHRELLPHRDEVARLSKLLVALGEEPVLARHPARLLRDDVLRAERPIELVTTALEQLVPALEQLSRTPNAVGRDGTALVLAAAVERTRLAARVQPLAKAGALALLDSSSELYRRFKQTLATIATKSELVAGALKAAAAWRTPISRADLAAVTALAQRWHEKLLRFFFPSFWRLRSILRERFDFRASLVPPPYLSALQLLDARYQAEDALELARREGSQALGLADLDGAQTLVAELDARGSWTSAERALKAELVAPDAGPWAETLAAYAPEVERLSGELGALFDGHQRLTLAELQRELTTLSQKAASLPELCRVLGALRVGAPRVADALRELPLRPESLEWAVCERAIVSSMHAQPTTAALTGRAVGLLQEQLDAAHSRLRKANAAHVVERARLAFLERVQRAAQSAAGQSADHKAFKRDYSAGRRDLEHEMGKVMRFKAIRELMTGPTGLVIRDLKPVWLMSPLSVADTLPLASEYFDVVIFDEASQIPLEDAIPAIHRAEQCIVVGDEMQLPPTNFFGAAPDEDGTAVTFHEGGQAISYELDADSLLAHAARTLPSTMLGWHYRSRDEALIQFSNQAFYEGKLATVPTPGRSVSRAPIRAASAAAGFNGARLLLERSVSHHRLDGATYDSRTNRMEAEYIAELLRGLFAETKQSVGIVAFSEAQQGEIEAALGRVAERDAEFRARLEAEYERTEDDQFCGLFVKNLETVQGDERDIIILSICYGPDANGQMRMNFGPINKRGGEKRLNVIFSRARHHLAVVSSIDDAHITNDYNTGASTLRGYLRYAAALSRGDDADARAALRGVSTAREAEHAANTMDAATASLAEALEARGWKVERGVGGSRFRCELAVRRHDDANHRLAVLLDTDAHYSTGDADERHRVRPALLRTFGWSVEVVLASEWRQAPDDVVRRIEAALAPAEEPSASGSEKAGS
ncbi:MAG: DUF4011 domain-containing protein [Deltaproteobacteria bacterium]|nr:DUF4011 domain-containing protein [Deltaproteobacteria bacterium]